MVNYVVYRYRIPAELEEAAVALLWLEGCEGIQELEAEEGFARVEAYFSVGQPVPRPALEGVELLEQRDLVEEDWLESYRRQAQPLEIGRTLVVDPREPEEPAVEPAPGRQVLRVPARQAFGTGSHESTRLILELLEEAPLLGARVLDVGSGSGILSFAALALGARQAVGFDLDLPSAFLSGQYRAFNSFQPFFFAGRLDGIEAPDRFDVILVNVLPERILAEAHRLLPMLAEGGELLLSGILEERSDEVLEVWRQLGFRAMAQRVAGEWIAFRCRR